MVSNLPSSFHDITADPKIHVYDHRVKITNADGPEQIAAKCLTTHVLELVPDEEDHLIVEWSDQPVDPSQYKKKSKRQGLKLATMSPETGNIYVLLYNSKLLEICMRPSPEILLRNYGKNSRVLKLT